MMITTEKRAYGIHGLKSMMLAFASLLFFAGCASMPILGSKPSDPQIRVALPADSNNSEKIITLPLEKYLLGVLSKEVPNDWPLEALKAQAVASRTYATYRKSHPRNSLYDVSASTADQVFDKKHKYPEALIKAVAETKGDILTYNGEPFEAFFHSSCGGSSESASHVWQGTYPPPLESIHEDRFCVAATHSEWTYTIPADTIEKILTEKNYQLPKDWNIGIAERDTFGRVQKLTLEASSAKRKKNKTVLEINSNTLREMLGYGNIRSTFFELSEDDNGIVFTGKGSGHGVGLCQWGAKGQADEGKNYREILNFYYPGSDILPLDPKLVIKNTESEITSPETNPILTPPTPEPLPAPPPPPQKEESQKTSTKKSRNGVESIINNLPN